MNALQITKSDVSHLLKVGAEKLVSPSIVFAGNLVVLATTRFFSGLMYAENTEYANTCINQLNDLDCYSVNLTNQILGSFNEVVDKIGLIGSALVSTALASAAKSLAGRAHL